jgi:hypothetical protein
MNRRLITITVLGGLTFLSTAHATVVTWNFGGSAAQVANGTAYTTPLGTITAYADQDKISTGVIASPQIYSGMATESGLFRVNDSPNNHGVGIAPYNPIEGTSNAFASQDGLTDTVKDASGYNNFILLNLGSNIAQGTTLSFLLQAGVSGDTFDIYTQNGTTTPTKLGGTGGMTKVNSSAISVDEPGSILSNGSSQPTKPQYTITKSVAGVEWVAVSADCHYLLLDTITGTSPSPVPEPRFYGLLMAGLLGIAGIYARRRRLEPATA